MSASLPDSLCTLIIFHPHTSKAPAAQLVRADEITTERKSLALLKIGTQELNQFLKFVSLDISPDRSVKLNFPLLYKTLN